MKATASSVIDEVEGGSAHVVTKRGRPAAVLLPIEGAEDLLLANTDRDRADRTALGHDGAANARYPPPSAAVCWPSVTPSLRARHRTLTWRPEAWAYEHLTRHTTDGDDDAECESLDAAEIGDWRLPNAKELQSIVDYTRSPSSSDSPAIDPLFELTEIVTEDGGSDYPFLWSGTTHANLGNGAWAAYVAFGEALGWSQIDGEYVLEDVHGAGAQRSDPKTGDVSDYPYGNGPQGDVIRVTNHAVCVADM